VARLLSYGSELATIVSVTESRQTLDRVAAMPSAAHLTLSVEGPDPALVRPMIGLVAGAVDPTVRTEFLASLSGPSRGTITTAEVRPDTGHNVFYGGLAGLLVGCAMAAWSVPRDADEREGDRADSDLAGT
jgi:hypothetical protein